MHRAERRNKTNRQNRSIAFDYVLADRRVAVAEVLRRGGFHGGGGPRRAQDIALTG
jgi:hypothetical protein